MNKYWLVTLVVVVAGGFGYLIWNEYFNPTDADEFAKFEERYVAEMTADNYGGKTPQETLNLFIAALKKEDVDLAVKYFMYDDHLSKEKWVEYLQDLKNRGLLNDMAQDLEKDAKPIKGVDENDFAFNLYNNDGTVAVLIDMRFNTFSKIWKIESL